MPRKVPYVHIIAPVLYVEDVKSGDSASIKRA